MQNLYDNMAEYGYDLTKMPFVIQYNKRDLPNASPISELQAALNPGWEVADPRAKRVTPDPYHAGENLVEQLADRRMDRARAVLRGGRRHRRRRVRHAEGGQQAGAEVARVDRRSRAATRLRALDCRAWRDARSEPAERTHGPRSRSRRSSRSFRWRRAWPLRLSRFVLFVGAAVTDYIDGKLARSRKQETDLGRLLDPLADKLLLVATFVPMYISRDGRRWRSARPHSPCPPGLGASPLPFVTPLGHVRLPLVDRGRRARPRAVHDGLSPGGRPARRGDRRDRTGEVEDRVAVDLGRQRVLLVRRGTRRRATTAGGDAGSGGRSRSSTAPSAS